MTIRKEYSVVLEGVDALDLSVGVLRDLCDLLLEGSQRSARLMAEGRSVARGITPAWLSVAADCRVSRFAAGSLELGVQASRLMDVAPEIFAQQQLFPADADPDASALDLFLDAAEDAAAGRRDSERLDAGVLDILARAGSLFAKGGTRLSLARVGRSTVVLDAKAAGLIRTLAEETPAPCVSRLRGHLDSLTISTKAITLRLDDGRIVRGFAGGVDQDQLKALLGTEVVVEGWFNFRPSGAALRIEVDFVASATAGDAIWTQPPKRELASRSRPSNPAVDLDGLFGKWPGDESDEHLAEALRELQ